MRIRGREGGSSSIASPGTFHPTQSSRRTELTDTGSTGLDSETCTTQPVGDTISRRSSRTAPTSARPLPARCQRAKPPVRRVVRPQPKRCLSRTGRTKAAGRANATRLSLESCATQHGACLSPLWWMSALVVFEGVEALHVPLRLSHRPERSREFIRTLLS